MNDECQECEKYSKWGVHLYIKVPEFGIESYSLEKSFETEEKAIEVQDSLRGRGFKAHRIKWQGICPKCDAHMTDEQIKALIQFADFVIRDNSDLTYQHYALKVGILVPDLDTDWGTKRADWFEELTK